MNTKVGKRYTRKYADGKPVSSADLESAYNQAAQLVVEHGEEFLPLFERMDEEMQSRETTRTQIEKAREVAAGTSRTEDGPTRK